MNEQLVERAPGLSVRVKLTLSYVCFLMVAGVLMLAAVWVVLLRYVPDGVIAHLHPSWWIFTDRSDPLNGFGATAAFVLALLLVFGLVGGWLLAGRMLAPLTRITEATRVVATGALSHRIRLPGHNDELRELADSFDAMLVRLEAQVAEQQRFAANASHELRTPLATTQTLLEVAHNDPECDTSELVDRLRVVNTARSSSPKRCSCSAAPTSGRSLETTSTCRSSRRKPRRRCSPSRNDAASSSRPPAR